MSAEKSGGGIILNRRAMIAGVAALSAAPGACATTAEISNPLAAAIAETQTPGMAAIVIRNYAAGRELVAGVRRLGAPAPVARGDRWHLGSDGKAMTATLIARLVERGVLSWEAPLEAMLPTLADTMHTEYRDVTLPDLLSHRAGLPENHSSLDYFLSFHDDPAPLPQQRATYIAAALTEAPIGAKRAKNSYSNTGFVIAGAIAERATGRAFEDLIVDEVFHPLGIRSVSFDQYGGANEPCGHVDGRVANQPRDANPEMIAPAGGMRMTMKDWARFSIDQMAGERGRGRLLSAAGYRFLHRAQGDTRAALGWGASPTPLGFKGPALVHSGSDGNWMALILLFPETGNGVLAAANAADSMGGEKATRAALAALGQTVAERAEDQ